MPWWQLANSVAITDIAVVICIIFTTLAATACVGLSAYCHEPQVVVC